MVDSLLKPLLIGKLNWVLSVMVALREYKPCINTGIDEPFKMC